jgi:hypothetical protein
MTDHTDAYGDSALVSIFRESCFGLNSYEVKVVVENFKKLWILALSLIFFHMLGYPGHQSPTKSYYDHVRDIAHDT